MNLSTLSRLKSGVHGVHAQAADEVTVRQQPEIVKDVQGVLRTLANGDDDRRLHARIPDSVRATVNAINAVLRSKPNSRRVGRNFLEICYQMLPNRKGQSL